jgi:hypothetical protein
MQSIRALRTARLRIIGNSGQRVPISWARAASLRCIDGSGNHADRHRTMTLSADEFIRRFLLHVLPKGFHRIRHDGLLGSACCKANIARAKELMAVPMPAVNSPAADDTVDPDAMTDHRPPCPCCGGRMIIVEVFARCGAPPGPTVRRCWDQDLM